MVRVLIHAGLHKTGTTTVQRALRRNAPLLSRYARVVLKPSMVAMCESARAYSQRPEPVELAMFQFEIAQWAEGWDAEDNRTVILASEDLSGHMPGRRGLTDYSAAPQLMATLAETLVAVRPEANLQFQFSTRKRGPWLASCHAQNLRASRMKLDLPDYAVAYAGSADHAGLMTRIAEAVPDWPVTHHMLEDVAEDPSAPLIAALDLPEAVRNAVMPATPANAAPGQAVLDELLALNRSDLGDAEVKAAKRDLLRKLRPPEDS